jgi:hypothetical protein
LTIDEGMRVLTSVKTSPDTRNAGGEAVIVFPTSIRFAFGAFCVR